MPVFFQVSVNQQPTVQWGEWT